MKIQVLAILTCAATLFAQEASAPAPAAALAVQIPCEASFAAVKDAYPKDVATNRAYAMVEARIKVLKDVEKDQRKGEIYNAEEKNCELAVNLFKIQQTNAALRKSLDSLTQRQFAVQKDIFDVKDSLIDLWTSDAKGAKSLNAALDAERTRLETLNREKAEEQARMAEELAKKQKELAEKDSLLAAQKAEAEKKLYAMQSKAISVFRDARGTILSMSDILFETGKANLTQELQVNLGAIGAILQSLLTESKVVVEGHTDNVGSADFNQKLSEQRAQAVMQFLVGRGIEAGRLEAVGHGLTKPVADNSTKEGQAKNRRVELVIKD
ncbi:MAG: OmpA family protein [Fibromonadales bacterium]|nr:OmpA family protein [Fibromonadales bacterium]